MSLRIFATVALVRRKPVGFQPTNKADVAGEGRVESPQSEGRTTGAQSFFRAVD
jgi:hypothetical protein